MKKKILLVSFIVALFVCLFAISISATTYNYYENEISEDNKLYTIEASFGTKNTRFELISSAEGEGFAKTDADGNALTWYVVSDDLGETTSGVRNIVVKSTPTIGGVVGNVDTNGNYTYGTDTDGVSFSKKVVVANFFGTEVKTLPDQAYMATYKYHTPGQKYQYCQIADGSYLLELYLPKSLTYIPKQLCFRSPVIVLEFEDNEVIYENFGEGVKGFDTQWKDEIAYAFSFCANLKRVVIPEGIKTVETHTFRECMSLEYVKFPSTMTRLEDFVFFHAIGLETVVLGENMTFAGYFNSDYRKVYDSWQIRNFNMKYIYVPKTISTTSNFDSYQGMGNNAISATRNVVFLFVGTLDEAKTVSNFTGANFKNAISNKAITYEEYISNKEYYDTQINGHTLVYNVPTCIAFHDGHNYEKTVVAPTCTTVGYTTYTCTACGDSYTDNVTEALGHSMSGWTLTTAPVYGKVGQETNECANCDYFEVRDYIAAAAIGNTYYASFEAALANAKAGDTIVLLAPVTVTEDTELNIEGITIESTGDAFVVTNGATLTLNGNFTVNAGTAGVGSWCAVWANGGHAVINGGSYSVGGDSSTTDVNHQNDLIYTSNGGTVIVNGGTFDGRNGIWALNEKDNNRGTIMVYGGTFIGFDPSNNVSEGKNTNFLADGLHATSNGDVYTVEAHSFDTVSSIAYANGYGKAGVKVTECACGETKEESVDALFVTLGYSASEAELGGITVGYKMNNEAIAKYEEITGNELVYGVFAAASEVIGNDDIFDANGNTVSGVISKEVSSMKLEALNLKLVGFNTEELMVAEIVMGMYVNDGARVSYVQPEAPISGNKYHTVSYSKLPKEEE